MVVAVLVLIGNKRTVLRLSFTSCIVEVVQVPQILHSEPSLDASSLRSDFMSSIKIFSSVQVIPCAAVSE